MEQREYEGRQYGAGGGSKAFAIAAIQDAAKQEFFDRWCKQKCDQQPSGLRNPGGEGHLCERPHGGMFVLKRNRQRAISDCHKYANAKRNFPKIIIILLQFKPNLLTQYYYYYYYFKLEVEVCNVRIS